MKLLWIIADAARLDRVTDTLVREGAPGWTVAPVEEGMGRTGLHAGDRVHPGALAAVTVVAEDARAARLFDALVRDRDDAEDRVTRVFLLPVEREA